MSIRKARSEDAHALAALSIEVWLQTYCQPGIPALFADYVLQTYSPTTMLGWIEDPNEHILLDSTPYIGSEGLRGYIRWQNAKEPPLPSCAPVEIASLYVRDHHKGQGIGSALLEAASADMRREGLPAYYLTVNAENIAALAFYRKRGLEEIGACDFEIDGRFYPNLVMQKAL